jgi:hypothetical protein
MDAFEHVLEQWTTFGWERWRGEQLTRLGEVEKEEAALLESRRNLVKQTKGIMAMLFMFRGEAIARGRAARKNQGFAEIVPKGN